MTCHDMNSKLADVLFEVEDANAEGNLELRTHLEACADCREQLKDLRATMALLDSWEAPEPNPYFLTRLNARLDEERAAAPASWPARVFAGLRSRLMYGSRLTLRPVAAMAMTVIVLAGGGAYLGLSNLDLSNLGPQQPPPQTAAVVHDLQTLDNNAQLLDQLETMSSPSDAGQNDD